MLCGGFIASPELDSSLLATPVLDFCLLIVKPDSSKENNNLDPLKASSGLLGWNQTSWRLLGWILLPGGS